jgi:hypothetical protein
LEQHFDLREITQFHHGFKLLINTCHRTGDRAVATGAEGADGVCVLMIYCSGAAYLQIICKVSSKSLASSYLGIFFMVIQFLIIKVAWLPWIQKKLLRNIVDADS